MLAGTKISLKAAASRQTDFVNVCRTLQLRRQRRGQRPILTQEVGETENFTLFETSEIVFDEEEMSDRHVLPVKRQTNWNYPRILHRTVELFTCSRTDFFLRGSTAGR